MKRNFLLLLIGFLSACTSQQKATEKLFPSNALPIVVPGKLFTSIYMQRAAEYRALCYQAYNIAKIRIDQWQQTSTTKPPAIITDIDETILDNSPYAAHQALQGKDYDQKSWEEWTAMAQADTVPGALAFLKYASSKGVEVFYITNRLEIERPGTLQNLQRLNFPNADNMHLVTRQTFSSKEERRQHVAQTHNILLLMGDDLTDFSALYDRKNDEERLAATQQLITEFGTRFIVLPNPDYGNWETALYNYNYSLTPAQKDSVIRSIIKTY